MKNAKKLVLLFLTASVLVVSCTPADNEISTTASITEKWEYSKAGTIVLGNEVLVDYPKNTPNCEKNYVELIASGELKTHDFTGTDCTKTSTNGTWTRTDNTIALPIDGIPRITEIVTLTDTNLKLKYVLEDKIVLLFFTKKQM